MVFEKTDEVEVLPGPTQGSDLVFKFLEYLDRAMTRLVRGSVLPSGGGGPSQGSQARAQTEQETSNFLLDFDREILGETLTRDLMGLMWRMNKPILNSMGSLGDAKMPKITVVKQEKQRPSQNIEVILKARQAKIPLVKKEVYEKIDHTMPKEDDEVFDEDLSIPGFGEMSGQGEDPRKESEKPKRDVNGNGRPEVSDEPKERAEV